MYRWKLKPTELNLLCHLVKACVKRGTTSADIPAYLPHASSRIPHRLVVFHLMQSCQALLLLGPEPSLSSLLPQVPRYWNVVRDKLEELQALASRSIAPCHVSVSIMCHDVFSLQTEEVLHTSLCSLKASVYMTVSCHQLSRHSYYYISAPASLLLLKGVSVEPQCKACLVVNRALGRCVFMHFGNTSLALDNREEERQHGGFLCIEERCACSPLESKMLV